MQTNWAVYDRLCMAVTNRVEEEEDVAKQKQKSMREFGNESWIGNIKEDSGSVQSFLCLSELI